MAGLGIAMPALAERDNASAANADTHGDETPDSGHIAKPPSPCWRASTSLTAASARLRASGGSGKPSALAKSPSAINGKMRLESCSVQLYGYSIRSRAV